MFTLERSGLDTIQLNLGYKCNQACSHCHVEAGPSRTELMTKQTMLLVLNFIDLSTSKNVDVTGGAPELNPHFIFLIDKLVERGLSISNRCNLTVLYDLRNKKLPQFFAKNQIKIIASLPCFSAKNVDSQRGKGVFSKSIFGLQQLNKVGYGLKKELVLDLVYNPNGAFLPPDSEELVDEYRRALSEFGVQFNELLTLTNMPIKRFKDYLIRTGELDNYSSLLRRNFNKSNLAKVMCKKMISVDWQGFVYDCDFNQMLELPALGQKKIHISKLNPSDLKNSRITVDEHCFGCLAGKGSSCGGALQI